MTDTERKEVEELALILFKTDYPRTSPDDVKEEDKEIYKLQAIDAVRAGYTKRPQDNNALVPLDMNKFLEISAKHGHLISPEYFDEIKSTFGKDNNGMDLSDEIAQQKNLIAVERLAGNIVKQELHKGIEMGLRMAQSKLSQQPPKEPCSHDWQYNSDIKGVAQCSKCDEYQLPKERKVSLEEIKQITKLYRRMSEDGYSGKFSCAEEAILSLLKRHC